MKGLEWFARNLRIVARSEEGNSAHRHHSYQAFIHLWRGHMGCGYCIKLPSCVLEFICGDFPDETEMDMWDIKRSRKFSQLPLHVNCAGSMCQRCD
jgi:hypothetical protein